MKIARGIKLAVALSCAGISAAYCTSQPPIDDLERRPEVMDVDKKYAQAFRSLDGTWHGRFHIYETAKGSRNAKKTYEALDIAPRLMGDWDPAPLIKAGRLRFKQSIDVIQVYRSETPYFQRVEIEDSYRDSEGRTRVVKSRGVNKIQAGVMWCVVRKPHETVIHQGSIGESDRNEDVIIWERSMKSPTRIEYFHETVEENAYTIRGWGKYGKDNPREPPRLFFLGEYKRRR